MITDKLDEIDAKISTTLENLNWVKLVGVGNTSSGKTCLIKYFCENKFSPGYQPTVGVDYGFKIETIGGKEVRVHLWDLSGSDEYYETRIELYAKTDGIFITYDVTSQSSFDGINMWYEEITRACVPKPVIILCACKVDQKQKRIITKERGEEWAKQHKMGYFESSAATGENVLAMYNALVASIMNKR
ncbi:dnaJ homolog subfamily C member 27-like [Watersipora subatra]|uniref:dnaJ homolog subfamily C member 27-like n=1 Tax=Watersipora subatra TaxID=2589382 RepID=UPI00355B7C84